MTEELLIRSRDGHRRADQSVAQRTSTLVPKPAVVVCCDRRPMRCDSSCCRGDLHEMNALSYGKKDHSATHWKQERVLALLICLLNMFNIV